MQPLVDEYFGGVDVKVAQRCASNLGFVGLCWAALAAHFILSDVLYLNVWHCAHPRCHDHARDSSKISWLSSGHQVSNQAMKVEVL